VNPNSFKSIRKEQLIFNQKLIKQKNIEELHQNSQKIIQTRLAKTKQHIMNMDE
jgi:hypothetical protein